MTAGLVASLLYIKPPVPSTALYHILPTTLSDSNKNRNPLPAEFYLTHFHSICLQVILQNFLSRQGPKKCYG